MKTENPCKTCEQMARLSDSEYKCRRPHGTPCPKLEAEKKYEVDIRADGSVLIRPKM